MAFESPFIDADSVNNSQLIFLFTVYAYVLYQGSNYISDGSELLQLIPSIAGIVGSIVLPILGAVPDGMMVLFSGIGPDAQNQVAVGVGALAGSTIMLLTIPWFLAVLGGRVNIVNGQPRYRAPEGAAGANFSKLDPPGNMSLFGTGVAVASSVGTNAKLMILTSCSYLIIQYPASKAESEGLDTEAQAAAENQMAGLGLGVTILFFFGYLYVMANESKSEDKAVEKMVAAIKSKTISTRGVMNHFRQDVEKRTGSPRQGDRQYTQKLLDSVPEETKWMKKILWPFFSVYDRDGNKTMDVDEFTMVLADLGEQGSSRAEIKKIFQEVKGPDDDCSGLQFEEFVRLMCMWALDPKHDEKCAEENLRGRKSIACFMSADNDDEEGEGEEEDVPEGLENLSPAEQQKRILMMSFWQMGMGTLMVLFFSDPMVDVLGEIGVRTGVPKFYVAFVLAPLASNASELIAAFNYASKKSQRSMATSLSTLCGAACMNNTFCLAIFLALVKFRGLAWQFTAETISIVLVQLLMGVIVLSKSVQTLFDGLMVLCIYPVSLVLVWSLENKVGLD